MPNVDLALLILAAWIVIAAFTAPFIGKVIKRGSEAPRPSVDWDALRNWIEETSEPVDLGSEILRRAEAAHRGYDHAQRSKDRRAA